MRNGMAVIVYNDMDLHMVTVAEAAVSKDKRYGLLWT